MEDWVVHILPKGTLFAKQKALYLQNKNPKTQRPKPKTNSNIKKAM